MAGRLGVLFFLLAPFWGQAQVSADSSKLQVMASYADYQLACKTNPDKQLLELKKVVPGIVLDIRYATKNNFMKQVMYRQAKAFARRPVAAQLKKIQAELKTFGYGLKIYDAYRPYAITVAFYQKASNKAFVANPKSGSKHNRGCAVDLSLISLKTGKELEMPTPYDSFAPEASPTYTALSAELKNNRDFLIAIMHKYGFRVIHNEWWHFDFIGWQKYELMDIPFEKL